MLLEVITQRFHGDISADLEAQQGKRYGQWLLMDAIKRCALVGLQSGVYALLVDAKNADATRFYERFGFVAIAAQPTTLYLPLETGLRTLRATPRKDAET